MPAPSELGSAAKPDPKAAPGSVPESTPGADAKPTLSPFEAQVRAAGKLLARARQEIAAAIVGQHSLVDALFIGLLTNSHVLLEGVPGLAKTATVKALAQCIDAKFTRVQFTPDLLPADVLGTLIYNPRTQDYTTRFGPVFTNILLADEINRCPPKVQSALLEAMQEHQVTLGETTYPLEEPFLVLATENPLEQDGTYPLPEAQVDRFMLKVFVDYPTPEQERLIQDYIADGKGKATLDRVLTLDQVKTMRKLARQIHISDKLKDYIVRLVTASRRIEDLDPSLAGMIRYGGSPRATINLTLAARAHAMLRGRAHATPDDVKALARPVLGHRIIVSYEAEAEGLDSYAIVDRLLGLVKVP